LDKIPKTDLSKIHQILHRLKTNPRPHGCKKLITKFHKYRIRKGNYRIIYTINDTKQLVSIILVQLRKEVYRKLIL